MTLDNETEFNPLDHWDMIDSLMCDGYTYDEACEIIEEGEVVTLRNN